MNCLVIVLSPEVEEQELNLLYNDDEVLVTTPSSAAITANEILVDTTRSGKREFYKILGTIYGPFFD